MEAITKQFKERVFRLSVTQVVSAYLVMLVALAGLWLTRGNYLGSFAGGLFFGLLINPESFIGIKRNWIKETAFIVGIITIGVLDAWKEHALMPPDWEPARAQMVVGFLGLFVALAIAAILDLARTPQEVIDTEAAKLKAEAAERESESQDNPEQVVPAPRWLLAIAGMLLVVNVLAGIGSVAPHWFSNPQIAVARYIARDLYDYSHKNGLAYTLSGLTTVSIVGIERHSSEAVATLRVRAPVAPFLTDEKQANSRAAANRYFDIAIKDRPVAEFNGVIKLKPAGLAGWEVAQSDLNLNPVLLSERYRDGELRASPDTNPILFPLNMFGLHDLMLQPLNIIAFTMWIISLVALVIGTRKLAIGSLLFGSAFLAMTLGMPYTAFL